MPLSARERVARYRAKNREKLALKQRDYAAKNREKILAKNKTPEMRAYFRNKARARRLKFPAMAALATRRYRERHPERAKALEKIHNKTFYQRHGERIRAYIREKYARATEAERALFREYAKRTRLRHPQRVAARVAAWAKAHPDRRVVINQRRRARKANAPRNDLTHTQWLAIQQSQDHRCAYCGKRCKGKLTQDHITPLVLGGSHTLHNVIAVCRSCNSRKHVGPPPVPVQPLLL